MEGNPRLISLLLVWIAGSDSTEKSKTSPTFRQPTPHVDFQPAPLTSGGLPVHLAFRDSRELLVGRFLLIQVLLEHARAITPPELFGPGDQRTVTGDFVMLDRLRRSK